MHLSVAPGISQLSQELIDEIIDHFQIIRPGDSYYHAKEKADNLRTCALISRVFRSRSQKHLFTYIGVEMTDSNAAQSTWERLKDVFSTNPQLASYVKILTLTINETGDLWSRCVGHPNFLACLAHMSEGGGDKYPRLCGLQIYLATKSSYECSDAVELSTAWSDALIYPTFRFVPSIVTSHLTSIEIHHLHNVPIALFDACHSLATLNISGITLALFEEAKRIPIEKRPLIRELSVDGSEDLICRTGLRFDKLERLVFHGALQDRNLGYMRHIFRGAASNLSSLEYLNFFLPLSHACDDINTHLYPQIRVDFSRMPNLRELKIQAICFAPHDYHDDETEMDMITGLSEFLATFPAEHKLKRMSIFFDCSIDLQDIDHYYAIADEMPGDIELHLRTGNWAAFDSAIVRIANSAIDRPLQLTIIMEYFLELGCDKPETVMDVPLERARTKDQGTLEQWAAKFLPRTNESPHVVMEVITQYGDSWGGCMSSNSKRKEDSGADSKPALGVGE